MWTSFPAWSRIALTTLGWQCPALVTAIPAVKSRKRLPSRSSTIAPFARLMTSGYMRVYDGDMTRSSRASHSAARGPGIGPTMRGSER